MTYPATTRYAINVELVLILLHDPRRNVDGRTASNKNGFGILAHLDHPVGGLLVSHEMQVGELGHGMAHFLVDGAG